MKEIFCKYCGRELENGTCKCDAFLNAKKIDINLSHLQNEVRCPNCKKKIDRDSIFCSCCGLPVNVDRNNEHLKKELMGEYAEDVIKHYGKERKTIKMFIDENFSFTSRVVIISLLAIIVLLLSFNVVRTVILNNEIKNELMNEETYETVVEPITQEIIEPTTQPYLELKDKWIRQDGFFYCFDKNGDAVINDWVTETDADGNEKKYYFDMDGKLVVNSYIDGEYYVGPDGAMLKDTDTPDGAHVDADGKVVFTNENMQRDITETKVYYEETDATSKKKQATTVNSANSGVIKGIDKEKKYALYIKDLVQLKETVTKKDDKCDITFYYPIIDGDDPREVKIINEKIVEIFNNEFRNMLVAFAKNELELPKTITMNEVEQRTLNGNRYQINVAGRVLPRNGLYEKRKYRVRFDRKSKQILLDDITQ